MANYFYGPYNFLKSSAAIHNQQAAVLCPQCNNPRVHQIVTPLLNPKTLRPILSPEWIITLSLVIGLLAFVLILLGSWWAISGAWMELVVFYLIMIKLPLAFRAREQQLLRFCCQQCGHRWQKENLL